METWLADISRHSIAIQLITLKPAESWFNQIVCIPFCASLCVCVCVSVLLTHFYIFSR